jgi:phage baseplate assembly protein W
MQRKQIGLRETVTRVLMTPLESRVMRPEFGSRLFELVDRTYDSRYQLDVVEYTAKALEKNIPHIKIEQIRAYKGAVSMVINDGELKEEVRVVFA